jgi:hypothetical protein
MTALRIDQTQILPRLVSPGATHVVFRDANANGTQDSGEDGVGGIVVTCGNRTLVTDARGRFKCGAKESFAVDQRSLPAGWVAPAMSTDRPRGSDIGLLAMIPAHVFVDLVDVDTVRVPRTVLSKLMIVARDSANQPWLARDLGTGAFVFDALPAGHYTLETDVSGIDEPLVVSGSQDFRIDGRASPSVRVTLRGRAVRIRILPPTQSDGGASPAPRNVNSTNVPRSVSKEMN